MNHLLYFRILVIVAGMLAAPYSEAQSVSGRVSGSRNESLANVTVLLHHAADSSLVKGALTNASGDYSFEKISRGSYLVSASYAGLQTGWSQPFAVDAVPVNVPVLQLKEKESALGEVVVTARKPLFEQKIDRMVINVASSITSAGSTALEVLMRSPGVRVDQQNNILSMMGKDGVVVMINGKISRMPPEAIIQMLAGMNASNIEKIELITTPPASFDAEGNAGFINIVMKRSDREGTNGSYALTAGYGKKPAWGAAANFNHRKGRLNIFGDYSYAYTPIINKIAFYRKVQQTGRVIESDMDTDRDAVRVSHNGRLGIDLECNSRTTVGLLLSGLSNLYRMEAVNTSYIRLNGVLDTVIIIDNPERHPLGNYAANFNIARQMKKEQSLAFNLDYVHYRTVNTVHYTNRFYNGNRDFLYQDLTRSRKATPIRFWVGSLDYTAKLSATADLEAGIKAGFSKFVNDVLVERGTGASWTTDPSLSALHDLQENISAAYVSITTRFSEKTTSKLGLRYEYTNSNLGSETQRKLVDRHYGRLFPSFFLSHTISDNSSWNLSYSRRITRPTFDDMAPFVYFLDPNTLFSGNPALQPTIANSLKTDYTWKRLIISLSYTYEDAPITNFAPRVDPVTNKQTLASENQKNKHVAALALSFPIRVSSWWNMQLNFTGIWSRLNAIYKGTPLSLQQNSLGANGTQSFSLPKDFSIELSAYYQSGDMLGLYRLKAFGSMDIGVQKKFAAKRSSLRLSVSDVFGPPVFRPSVNLPEQNLVVDGRLTFVNRMVRLTYTCNFGNDKLVQKRERATASQEERQRVKTE